MREASLRQLKVPTSQRSDPAGHLGTRQEMTCSRDSPLSSVRVKVLPLFVIHSMHLPSVLRFLRCVFALLPVLALVISSARASDLVRDLAAGRTRTVVVYGTSLTASGAWVTQMQSWLANTYSGTLVLYNGGLSGKNSAEGVVSSPARSSRMLPIPSSSSLR